MLKVGDKIVKIAIHNGEFDVTKEEIITHVGVNQFWTKEFRHSNAYYFDGTGRIPVPDAPVPFTPRPFAYCTKENVKITKAALIEVFNKAQTKRANELNKLLETTGLIEAHT